MTIAYLLLFGFVWLIPVFIKNINLANIVSIILAIFVWLFTLRVSIPSFLELLPGSEKLILVLLIMYLVRNLSRIDISPFVLLLAVTINLEIYWSLAALLSHFCYKESKKSVQLFIFLLMFLGEIVLINESIHSLWMAGILGIIILMRNIELLKNNNLGIPSNFIMTSVYAIVTFKYIKGVDLGINSIFSLFSFLYIFITSIRYKKFNSGGVLILVIIHYLHNLNPILLLLIPLVIYLQTTDHKFNKVIIEKNSYEINILLTSVLIFMFMQSLVYFGLDILEAILLIPIVGLAVKAYVEKKINSYSISLERLVTLVSSLISIGIMFS